MNFTGSEMLVKSRIYVNEVLKNSKEIQRPSFHVSSPVGWLNDPNGFSLYKGEYHLFFQYHPYSILWGPMHWGHMKTVDFIRWETLPVALAPDEEYDIKGCFSGSAIEADGKHILMYTGVKEDILQDNSVEIRQTQCIAIGDGINYEKLDCNPVITGEMLPKGSNISDFRDPKIWKDGEHYYAIVANRSVDESGQLLLFKSDDLKNWERYSIFDKCDNEYGKMWECPDYFELDGKEVVIISPQDMQAKELEFHNGNGNLYFIGNLDKSEYIFHREICGVLDYGLDFYAPQTLQTLDGRRILIGWMESWDNYLTPSHYQWSGMMTLPRELEIIEGKIYQKPVRELENYRSNHVQYKNYELSGTMQLEGIDGREIDMEVEVLSGEYEFLHINLACKDGLYTSIIYDSLKKIITFDRKYSGLRRDIICERKMNVSENSKNLKMRIIMDKNSIELFVNEGENVMSSLYFTDIDATGIKFVVEGKARVNITKYDIIVS